jgi:RimJ/RimL family protein N-acetyltransferase
MILLTPSQTSALRDWFRPEQPGYPLIGPHVVQTGHGACWVDRWPNPRAVLAGTFGNYYLSGNPDALQPPDLPPIAGFVHAPDAWESLLRAAFPSLGFWDRVLFGRHEPPRFTLSTDFHFRRLTSADAYHVWGLSPEINWIWSTWGGPSTFAASGYAWGAWQDDRLVSVACTFFLGEQYEEIGIVTEPEWRGLGLSAACAGALCEEIQARGHQPSWSTSPDNRASIRVAEKLGFRFRAESRLYAINTPIPNS